jgi:hypothetical protein
MAPTTQQSRPRQGGSIDSQKQRVHDTATPRRAARMTVRGCVRITLYPAHADGMGFPTRDAERVIWRAVANLPDGATVVLDLGPLKYPSPGIIRALSTELGPTCQLVIEARTSATLRDWLAALKAVA